jgi:hypothetical protein
VALAAVIEDAAAVVVHAEVAELQEEVGVVDGVDEVVDQAVRRVDRRLLSSPTGTKVSSSGEVARKMCS